MTPKEFDPQLVLKTTPPRAHGSSLHRARLSSTAPEFSERAVIAVQAPAGFGKTSLLAQWRREALQRGAAVAWLTLDASDDNLRLVQGLILAMRVASGRPGFESLLRQADPRDGGIEQLTGWLAEVADMAIETLLILDDVHALPGTTIDSGLVYLLQNAPANLRVVLASRKPIDLPFVDIMAHGGVTLVDTTRLKLRLAESVTVTTARFGARIDTDTCVRLHDLTEGWPLGLQLVLATIESQPDLREAVAGFSVHSGNIQRYFVESLVARLPESMAEFLTQICFVDAVHPALCEAITQRVDSDQMLARVRDSTPIFTEGLESEWLRIHPLAGEFLIDRFSALPLEERRQFHSRAMHWLATHQMYEDAARQALQAGQDEYAYELIERCLHDVLANGHVARASDLISHLPAAQVARRPGLSLAIGWTYAMSDRYAEAAKIVELIVADPVADIDQRCEAAEMCATAAYFADDTDEMSRIMAPWFGTMPARAGFQRAIGANVAAVLAYCRGEPQQARKIVANVSSEMVAVGSYTRGWTDWIIGASYFWEGQVALGEVALRSALARAERDSGRRSPVAVMLAAALAATLWERNLAAEAGALLSNRLDVLESRAAPDALIMGYITAARLACHEGLERRAIDLLENLHALGSVRNLPRLRIAGLVELVRLHALRSRGEACAASMLRLDEVLAATDPARWGARRPQIEMQTTVARAYAAVARKDWRRTLELLTDAGVLAEQLRAGGDIVQIRLLRSLALARSGGESDALFVEALSLAQALGLERIVADTHPDLIAWAERIGRKPGVPIRSDSSPLAAPAVTAAPRVLPSALLTPKEREVLSLLAGYMSNKQIANALDVSEQTVKWHLKNLFGKLQAGTRKHAIDRARMLGVLDTGD